MDMAIDDFKRVVDAIPFAKVVTPQAVGESLMHPDVVEAINYLKQKGKEVHLFTNVHYLDEKMSKRLLLTGIDRMVFSVDTDRKDEYERIRPPLKWERLLENVATFRRLRDEGRYKTRIHVRMTETEYNRDRYQEIANFWKVKADLVLMRPVRENFVPGEHPNTTSGKPLKCSRVGKELIIKVDGSILLCCEDWYYEYPIDKINFNTVTSDELLSIFNNEVYTRYRESIRTGDRYPHLCDVCLLSVERRRGKMSVK